LVSEIWLNPRRADENSSADFAALRERLNGHRQDKIIKLADSRPIQARGQEKLADASDSNLASKLE
jgi:hypothetical protein